MMFFFCLFSNAKLNINTKFLLFNLSPFLPFIIIIPQKNQKSAIKEEIKSIDQMAGKKNYNELVLTSATLYIPTNWRLLHVVM